MSGQIYQLLLERLAKKRATRTFISEIVTKAQHEFKILVSATACILRDEALGDFTLVDETGAYFEICFTSQDLDVVLANNGLLQLILAFSCLESAVVRVSPAIMPSYRSVFGFDEGALTQKVSPNPATLKNNGETYLAYVRYNDRK
jgi:hypothetical protein